MKNYSLFKQFTICNFKLPALIVMFVMHSMCYSQITINFTVDMTGNPIAPGGVHIAGDFFTNASTTILEDWNPAADGSQLTHLYGAVYGIEVSFPEASIGQTLQFQFLRDSAWFNIYGDMSEGNAGTHFTLDCSIGDGFFGYNRIITIPGCNAEYNADWNYCAYLEYSEEVCNGLDDDCNGIVDDGLTETISISAGGPIIFCQGGNVILTATFTGATVQWKKGGVSIPGATASTYTVNTQGVYTCTTMGDCGSATSTGIAVTVNKNPTASITAGGATTFCAGGSVVLTANAGGGLSYQWYKGAVTIAGATSINYTATIAGNYKCRVTKIATGCFKNSNTIAVTVPCKEANEIENEPLLIYPNPSTGQFTISGEIVSSENTTIQIYNNIGEIVYSKHINSDNFILNESIELNQPSGIYVVRLNIGRTVVENKLIIN